MHILMTADTVGGVWTYIRELATQLSRRGIRITLVSFGELPSAAQSEWMEELAGISFRPTAFRLEWMQDAQSDLRQSTEFLQSIIDEVKPDILHFNQFYFAGVDWHLPRIVVAHSDVVSWWVSVHGAEPPEDEWIRTYRENVRRGWRAADLAIAPTQWMLDRACTHYGAPKRKAVVYNGRDPNLFSPNVTKGEYAISIGRLWDAGKQATLLLRDDLPVETILIGPEQSPAGAVASAQSSGHLSKLQLKGLQPEAELNELLARAAMYVATSRYEPFGLAPLEAALSRCALVLNDIPTLREIWGDAAVYFERNNAASLVLTIQELASNPTLRSEYGARALERALRFNSDKMAEEYLAHYRTLVSAEVAAA